MVAKNLNFDQQAAKPHLGILNAAGLLPIGTGNLAPLPEILAGSLISTTLTIGYSSPNITIETSGGGSALEQITVDNSTLPGTNPVLPSGGNITITGGQVANASLANVIQTHSLAANSFAVTIQRTAAVSASDSTKNGVSHFDSDIFTVDANGFVSTAEGTLVQAISGGPGITITGTAALPIVNSVIFTDTTAATLAVDNGYFATAAGTYDLPATAVQGELLIVVCDTAGAVVLDAPALNFIRIGATITSSGGTATSTAIGDSLTLRYRLSSLTWEATSITGIWITA